MGYLLFVIKSLTVLVLAASLTSSEKVINEVNITLTYLPEPGDPRFILFEGHNDTILVTVHGIIGNISVTKIESERTDFFIVLPTDYETVVENGTASFPIGVHGVFIGVGPLIIHLEHSYVYYDETGKEKFVTHTIKDKYSVRCGITPTIWNTIFTWSLTVWLVISYVAMGAKIDLNVVWSKLRRPFGVSIGIVCQFGIMPILAFCLAKVFPLSSESSIGLLIEGSCPGGWLSNVFALMMDVDFILSITMTFCSSFMALVMMPLNMFIYATPFVGSRGTLKTPYRDISIQLALMMVPVMIGMFILRKYPDVANRMTKGLKPISMGLIVITLVLGVPALSYIFVAPFLTYIAASLLPLIGGLLGFGIAKVFRRGYPEAFTIAFETGVQNSLLASVVARFSYPFPENYLIARLPLLTAILTIIEGTIMITIYVIYNIVTKKRGKPGRDVKGYVPCDVNDGVNGEDVREVCGKHENNNPTKYVALSSEDDKEPATEENGDSERATHAEPINPKSGDTKNVEHTV